MDGFIMGPFGPVELTEEQQEELRNRRDLHRMQKEDAQRAVDRLFEKLDVDELITVKTLLQNTLGNENDSNATYMIGWISSILHHVHKVCTACGEKHIDISIIEGDGSE